jgi:hypothetical protein
MLDTMVITRQIISIIIFVNPYRDEELKFSSHLGVAIIGLQFN